MSQLLNVVGSRNRQTRADLPSPTLAPADLNPKFGSAGESINESRPHVGPRHVRRGGQRQGLQTYRHLVLENDPRHPRPAPDAPAAVDGSGCDGMAHRHCNC